MLKLLRPVIFALLAAIAACATPAPIASDHTSARASDRAAKPLAVIAAMHAALAGTCQPCAVDADCSTGLCYGGRCYPQGVSTAPAPATCTLPAAPSPAAPESVNWYKPADTSTGWFVVTMPPSGITPIGWILLVHGGQWRDDDTAPGLTPTTGASPNNTATIYDRQRFAGIGYVVVSPAHRSVATFARPAQESDIVCAARAAAASAASFLSPAAASRAFIAGASSGASLAALVADGGAVEDGTCPAATAALPLPAFRGAILWSGVYRDDASDLSSNAVTTIATEIGCALSSCPTTWASASPWAYVHPGGPDRLIWHGAADPVLPPTQSSAYATQALGRGENITQGTTTGNQAGAHAPPALVYSQLGCAALGFLTAHP